MSTKVFESMSIFSNNINALVYDSIQECLDAARICIDTPKKEKVEICLGIPALILLCCAIDSIGSFYQKSYFEYLLSKFKGVTPGCHFRHFYDAFSDVLKEHISREDFCNGHKSILIAYRNRCVHNTGLYDNCIIKKGSGSDLYCKDEQGLTILNIELLYEIISDCFERLKREHPLPDVSSTESPSFTGNTSSNLNS